MQLTIIKILYVPFRYVAQCMIPLHGRTGIRLLYILANIHDITFAQYNHRQSTSNGIS